jgi:hypothetical protein
MIGQFSKERRTVTKIIILKKLLPRENKLNWIHKSELTLKKRKLSYTFRHKIIKRNYILENTKQTNIKNNIENKSGKQNRRKLKTNCRKPMEKVKKQSNWKLSGKIYRTTPNSNKKNGTEKIKNDKTQKSLGKKKVKFIQTVHFKTNQSISLSNSNKKINQQKSPKNQIKYVDQSNQLVEIKFMDKNTDEEVIMEENAKEPEKEDKKGNEEENNK